MRTLGQAHLTYLCVGGLALWVVAMPDDRYRSRRRSMRRTFTKSLWGTQGQMSRYWAKISGQISYPRVKGPWGAHLGETTPPAAPADTS